MSRFDPDTASSSIAKKIIFYTPKLPTRHPSYGISIIFMSDKLINKIGNNFDRSEIIWSQSDYKTVIKKFRCTKTEETY